MSKPGDVAEWPPSDLCDYYNSAVFLRHLRVLQQRLEKAYPESEAETIVFDAAADVLMREIQREGVYGGFFHRFPDERRFLRYLYETCCNKVIDSARSFQRRFRQLLDADEVQDTSMGPEEAAIQAEESSQAMKRAAELEKLVLDKLPKIDRLIFKHRLAGRTFKEIAALLDLGVATVHRRYKLVMRKLASQLESQGQSQRIRPMR